MAQFLVLEDHINASLKLRAGKVLDDLLYDVSGLQAGGVALIPYNDALMGSAVRRFNAIRRPEAEQPISLLGLFSAEGLFGDLQARTVFVATDGKAGASGKNAAEPMTFASAVALVNNRRIAGVVTLELAAGLYPLETFENIALDATLYVKGPDGGTAIAGAGDGIAGAGTAVGNIVNAGLTINALAGFTIEMTSGLASGEKRTIHSNTATGIVPSHLFVGAVAQNDTYRVYQPSARIGFGQDESSILARNVLGGASINTLQNSGSDILAPALTLVNVGLMASSLTSGVSRMAVVNSTVRCYGTLISSEDAGSFPIFSADQRSFFSAGFDIDSAFAAGRVAQLPLDDGLASSNIEWSGWGLTYGPGVAPFMTLGLPEFRGIICAVQISMNVDGGIWRIRGGSCINAGGDGLDVSGWGRCRIGACDPPFLAHSLDDDVQAFSAGARSGGELELADTEVIKTNQASGLPLSPQTPARAARLASSALARASRPWASQTLVCPPTAW